jgi:hypothetical protein
MRGAAEFSGLKAPPKAKRFLNLWMSWVDFGSDSASGIGKRSAIGAIGMTPQAYNEGRLRRRHPVGGE